MRRALLIGINDYPFINNADLKGCVGDVLLFEQLLLERFAFAAAAITILRDNQATRAGILGALAELTRSTEPDDLVLVYYAGHGSYRARARARGGQEQTLVPHDSGRRTYPNRDISEDELGQWLRTLAAKTDNVVLFFDSCHSETLVRSLEGGARFVEGDPRAAPEPAAAEVKPPAGPSGPLPPSDRYVVLSACRDEQQAWEYVERVGDQKIVHGTFSLFLIEALRSAGPRSTYRDLYERVAAQVTQAKPMQQPRCEGRIDRVLFALSEHDLPPARHVQVLAVSASQVTLAAGALHGVELGSRWALVAPGAPLDVAAQPRIQVSAVTDLRSEATPLDGAPPPLPLRAHPLDRPAALPRLALQLEDLPGTAPALRAEVTRQLATSDWLTLEVGATAPLTLRLQLRADGYTVRSTEGELLLAQGTRSQTSSLDLPQRLEQLARYLHVRGLNNPRSGIGGDVELQVLRLQAGGFAPIPGEPGGLLRCAIGDRLRLVVRNRSRGRRFASILAMGAALGITPIFPPLGVPGQALAPGEERTSEDFDLYPPPEPLLARAADGAQREYLKLLVSDEELDLAPLFQAGVPRSASQDELTVLLATALGGERSRELRAQARRDWTTELRELRWHGSAKQELGSLSE